MKCRFCGFQDRGPDGPIPHQTYTCPRCGPVRLTQECHDDFEGANFSSDKKKIISICLRTEYEKRGQRPLERELTLGDLYGMISHYRPLDPLEKMDNALMNLRKATKYVGYTATIDQNNDFPYYHCIEPAELVNLLNMLRDEGHLSDDSAMDGNVRYRIMTSGYEKLRELERAGTDSSQCFVAMWLTPEMNQVYEEAIQPAIEYMEEGGTTPRFKAVRIDNTEHTNDINDEIIAQIRRSRFMVCDLTGYRGGVYFEAGFAYGLGLEVIYTCKKDWINKQVERIVDSNGTERELVREGIHFDLEHRNRIEWTQDRLPIFTEKLENRIKAVVV